MTANEKINRRVSELIDKYSNPSNSVAQLLCDQYPSNKLAYKIINENMEEYDLSYGELKTQSTLLASGLLNRGIKKGDRIATLMGKSKEYIITLLAIWRIGAVHVPLFTAFSTPAITLRVNGSNSKIVFCDQKQQSKLKPSDDFVPNGKLEVITTASFDQTPNWAFRWEDLLATDNSFKEEAGLDPDAPIIHIFTSGTTGKPKGAIRKVGGEANQFGPLFKLIGWDRMDQLIYLTTGPLYHSGPLGFTLRSQLVGSTVVTQYSFDAEDWLRLIDEHRVTSTFSAPTPIRRVTA